MSFNLERFQTVAPTDSWLNILTSFESSSFESNNTAVEESSTDMSDLLQFLSGVPSQSPKIGEPQLPSSSETLVADNSRSSPSPSVLSDPGPIRRVKGITEERREINRRAAAKHRAKKAAVNQARDQELQNLRDENDKLRATIDQLRRSLAQARTRSH